MGLPSGSIRAALTLIVVAYIVLQTANGVEVKLLWSETLMIVLAHYFTSRRFVALSPDIIARLEADGELEADTNPLFLPKHSIRVLIVVGFIGLAVYLFRERRLGEAQAISVLGTVGAYFLGIFAKALMTWRARRAGKPTPRWWTDLKAFVTLAIVLFTVCARLLHWEAMLPFPLEKLENVTLGLVLFYFGSR